MMKKFSVTFIALLLVGSLLGVMFVSGIDEHHQGLKELEITDERKIIDRRLRDTIAFESEEEYIEVMIRLSPKEFENHVLEKIHWSEVITDLKEHARREQSGIIELIEEEHGRVLNTFWMANAVLAEVRVGSLNTIAEQKNVWKLHENFEVSVPSVSPSIPLRYPNEFHDFDGNHDFIDSYEVIRDTSYTITDGVYEDKNLTWGLERTNVTGVWDMGIDGSGIRVAVSDTGVDMNHPDLAGKMVNVDDDEYYTGGWIHFDEHGNIVVDSIPHDMHGHGTHCSGTVLGESHSGTHIGVAPGAELMHALVLPGGNGTTAQTIAGMEWKAEPHDRQGNILEPVEEHRAHVASMSWGWYGYNEYMEEPILNLKYSGVVPVAAIGNSGNGTYGSPGAIYETFGIGASDVNDDIASFSSGAIVEDGRDDTPEQYVKPDFSAPGVNVLSAAPRGRWRYASGTSMAAPHVAGTVALMLESHMSVDQIYSALAETADYYEAGEDLGERQNTRYGHGIIDAGRAVSAISTIRAIEPTGINRTHATLRARVFNIPNDEAEVHFLYRAVGVDDWMSTDPVPVFEPQVIETGVDDLTKETTYEYKAVLEWDGQQIITMAVVFRTHRDVEVFTRNPENLINYNAVLRGEVTHMYVDEVELSFEYRRDSDGIWERVFVGNVTEPTKFFFELHDLYPYTYYEYKAIAEVNGKEFTGMVIQFTVGSSGPEWCDDENSYLISDVFDLQWMKYDLESNYTIINDIDATESKGFFGDKGFEPIGRHGIGYFGGHLDGRNHTIDGLYINRTSEDYVGLFDTVSEGEIRDVGLVNVNVSGDLFVGALVGFNRESTVENSYATGSVSSYGYVGGLVGFNFAGTVKNSYATGSVSGIIGVGGLAGYNINSHFTKSYATGDVDGGSAIGGLIGATWDCTVHNSYSTGSVNGERLVGGLIGHVFEGLDMLNSYATGNVNGTISVGGLVGNMYSETVYYSITNSYSTGHVSGEEDVGGLVGYRDGFGNHVVVKSFWDVETSGQDESDGGTGKTTAEMIALSTFDDANWDITDVPDTDARDTDYIWNIVDHETYPFFSWQDVVFLPYRDLTINIEGNGSTAPEGGVHTHIYNTEVTITATPDTGWYFSHWSGDVPEGQETNEELTIVMDNDKTITAHFYEIYHNLTVTIDGDGTTVPEEGDHSYAYGTEVNLTATSNEGWYFSHWSGDVPEGQEENEELTIVMDADKNITAHFLREEYTLEITAEGEGVTDPPAGIHVYEFKDEVTVTATPETGWRFSHWGGDVPEGEEENENITIVMDGDKTITAHFYEIYHNLTISVDGDGTTVPEEGDHSYAYGTEVNLTATPNEGWLFSHWTGDVPENESDELSITIVMDGDKNITAHFDEIQYPSIEIITPEYDRLFDPGDVTVEWRGEEGTYPISHYEIRLNDGDWVNIGTATAHTFTVTEPGDHVVSVRVFDADGNSYVDSTRFAIEESSPGSYWWLILLMIIVVVVIILVMNRGKGEEPIDEEDTSEIEENTIEDDKV